ncbi:MAG: multicopper oxidase domain-containing protein [Gemmatimonadetes bacterium]|uniref:Copper-containing nitrite reductase n=1 Tax=Candidatus Kutchimonas denitrificans TaxID=3056748 RepID=A0AAE4ZA24_9BACT|nr:multicopper oxidase domain-containing protein [Gemmatimonadota bacterium]NIR74871.1 multicopper oxidase domain-containing protein [Candidatus Kutchimonas denitrificans]NIR99982.1 multicopper oxidase domain-containing protein [Gemmatimonadota bacterium]NIT65566.1 multicopper oxidase domain-containing protein [Gemmatimonadota bacterium]NIU52536.1 multicopper oxidase domain-containing protein [Gemmatimonadota bacterium]
MTTISRRQWFKLGAAAAGFSSLAAALGLRPRRPQAETGGEEVHGHEAATVGRVSTADFDPMEYLTEFDYGRSRRLSDGRTLREYDVVAVDREIEVAPGVYYPAWTYSGRVPGPTLRCTEGDVLRVNLRNGGSHPHTIHFHGTHPPEMDGVFPVIAPGESFTYEFEAKPFGLHLYHCHTMPLKRHIHKGLYGVLIIDPPGGRPPARELVMMMNAFDTNFDGENEVYAVNTVAFYYQQQPIPVEVGEPVRVYLVNITEFDPVNSFHLHAGMFRVYRTGTDLERHELTDTLMMCQGERHVLEFELENPGLHMFHAHQSEFAELGWMGFFEAQPPTVASAVGKEGGRA